MTRLLIVCVMVGLFTGWLTFLAVRDDQDTPRGIFWSTLVVSFVATLVTFLVPVLFFGYDIN